MSDLEKKINKFILNSSLQSIFIYGDWIDPEIFDLFKSVCKKEKVFVSKLFYHNELGSVIAVDDYNEFAKEILTNELDINKIEEEFGIGKSINNKLKQNLFSKIYSNSYLVWKKFGLNRKSKLNEITEESDFMMTAAKNILIEANKNQQEFIINNPLFPTIFNRFWKIEHRKEYMNYFFDEK